MSRRTAIGLSLAIAAAVLLFFFSPPGLSPEARRLAAVWGVVVVLWISEAIPLAVTAMLAPSLAVLFGVAPVRDAFAGFGDPVLYLLVGSFFLARAFELSGLGRRFAYSILTLPGIAGHPMRILPVYGSICYAISMWTSNTATTALMFPIGLSVLKAIEDGRTKGRYATCLLLLCAFGASIGGLATPVGTPPNLIGLGLIERAIGHRPTFLEWMAVAVPVSLVMLAGLMALFLFAVRNDPAAQPRPTPGLLAERATFGPWSLREKVVLGVFLFTVVLWLAPGFVAVVAGDAAPVSRRIAALLPESVAALLGAGLLFIVPAGGRPALLWDEGYDIDWSTIVLFGGGICLGTLMLSSGLAGSLGEILRAASGVTSPIGVVALVSGLAIFLSESSSNTASATLIVPIAIALSTAVQIDPVAPALAATAASSLGFMLPVSTAPNAIVFGSGRIRLIDMARYGIALDLFGFVVLVVTAALLLR